MHARTLMSFALAGTLFAGCSRKETPPPAEPDTSAPSADAEATPEDSDSVRFAIPDDSTDDASITARERLAEAQQQPEGTSTAGAEIEQAELLAYYPPFYPLPLRMEGVEGIINVAFRVDTTGAVSDVTVLGATAPEFTDHAIEAVREWRFIPAHQNGEPVPVIVQTTVPFISEFGSDPAALAGSPLARMAFLDGRYYRINEAGKYVPANADPVPIKRVLPARPPEEQWGMNLRVTLTLTVNEVGRVLEPAIHESSGNPSFDQAALEAVRFWQFVPRLRDGNPLSSRAQLPILYGVEETE